MLTTSSHPVDLESLMRPHLGDDSIDGTIKSVLVEGIASLDSACGNHLSFCSAKEFPESFDPEGAIVLISPQLIVSNLVAKSNKYFTRSG